MSGKAFVDTNILVYAHDRTKGVKHDRALAVLEKLWDSGNGVLSTQVLQEFYFSLRRKTERPLALEQARSVVEDYLSWEIVTNTPQSVVEAISVEQRYGTSLWDALILHAAESSGAELLYSEDFSNGRQYGSVRAVNPLISE